MLMQQKIIQLAAAFTLLLSTPAVVMAQTNSAGEALIFNGTSTSVSFGNSSTFDAYPMTVMAWIKTTSTNLCGIVNKYTSSSFNGYQLLLNNGHIQAWYMNGGGGGTYYNKGPMDGGVVNDGVWHHVALSVDGSGARLCKDGVQVDNEVWTGTPSATTTTQNLYLGYYPGNATGYYAGEIDEVSLWSVGLLPSQVETYMNRSLTGFEPNLIGYWRLDEGTGTTTADDSGNGNPGTLTGGPTWTASTAPVGIKAPTGFSQNWTTIPNPAGSGFWNGIASSADGVRLAGADYDVGVYISTNAGSNWMLTTAPAMTYFGIASSADGRSLVAAGGPSLEISTNFGATWFPGKTPTNNDWTGTACSADGSRMFAVAQNGGGIWTSVDGGLTWSNRYQGPYFGTVVCSSDGMKAATAAIDSIYTSTNGGTNWNLSGASTNVDWYETASSADGNKLLTGVFVYGSSPTSNYLYLSTNAGATFNPIAFSNTWEEVAMSADGTKMLANTGTGTIYASSDSGATWQLSNVGVDNWYFIATSADGTRSATLGENGGVAMSLTSPSLQIAKSGANQTVSWPSPSTGFTLRERTNLTVGNWSLVPIRPGVTNSRNQVSIATTNQNFYLLEFP
jgi:hypothetical protein